MNGMGRQGQRSGAATVHHQRQYSDNFVDSSSITSSSSNGRWLQSAGLQHLQNFSSSNSSSSIPPLQQDYNFYGGGGGLGQGTRMYRNAQRGFNGQDEFYTEPSTPPVSSRQTTQMKSREDSPTEFSPGLLDLHSFDTELLPELPVPSMYDGSTLFRPGRGRSFDDSETYVSSKQAARAPAVPDTNVLTSFAADKEKASSVAKIKVVVRKRPLNKKELAKNEEDIIDTHCNSLTVHETKLKVDLTEYVEKHDFVFDAVLNEEVSNDEVYHETVEPIVPIIFQRTKATCFAYGQTGSGKTYTMKPLPLRASRDILRLMQHTYRNQGFQLFVSFFEIYGGKLFDLLGDRKKLLMREDGKQQVCIVGLQEYRVSDVEAIKELIEKGSSTRSTGTTGANEESSRSHAILQLAVKKSVEGNETKPPRLVGKLSFIDLAGSERGADTTDNDKQTSSDLFFFNVKYVYLKICLFNTPPNFVRMEGAEINKSLLALKECIRALDNDKSHIPFRGSKLTEVLRDSFVGNSRTVMISCISPSSGSCEHTLNTLRYADRVKSLSKGSNTTKKDVLSSTMNLKESTAVPLSSVLPAGSSLDDDVTDGWADQDEGDDFEESEDYEQEKPVRRENGRLEAYNPPVLEDRFRKPNVQTKFKELPKAIMKKSDSDDDLSSLLQEEEDLVSAHRKLVEETMNIVREEMNLLVEADQPGNQLDDYVTRLNVILSQKAAGILQLQNRLAHFQKRLRDHNVLVSSSGY
ncbi:Kinesin-like protein KIN-13B [Linum perenne]